MKNEMIVIKLNQHHININQDLQLPLNIRKISFIINGTTTTNKNDQNQEKASLSYRRHSSSPIDDELEIGHTKPSQKEHVTTRGANSPSSSKRNVNIGKTR